MVQQATDRHTSVRAILPALLLMLGVGPTNFVLYKVLFSTYGASSAFFVMQGVNLLYIIYGAIVLLWLKLRTSEITPEMESLPSYPFCVMAALDCLGGLLAAMGAAETPGQLQTLLNQSLVPCTMVMSCLLLGTRYSRRKRCGAGIILCGAVVVVLGLPVGDDPSGGKSRKALSSVIYWSSNLPMALSAVYKEERFGSDHADGSVHVMYLTQQVSIYQFIFGFAFAPVESIPGVATSAGLPLRAVFRNLASESLHVLGQPTSDKSILLLLYVLANFVLNVTGLYVTKVGSASLSAIASAVLMPCSTLAFSAPFLGQFREPLRPETLLGLALVFAGFGLYEFEDLVKQPPTAAYSPLAPSGADTHMLVPHHTQKSVDAFHERIVLVRVPVRPSSSEMPPIVGNENQKPGVYNTNQMSTHDASHENDISTRFPGVKAAYGLHRPQSVAAD